MSDKKIVVDGSNIATEGRSLPSLAQLVQAVADFQSEFPGYEVIVVVDATFGHRIDPSERAEFEAAEAAGELLSPPAGAIGRGDAFLLRIADRTGAMVLSNDSFQEFHGEFDWLFTKGRLLGGKPVPGVGWIFTPRAPVRGPKSREAVKEAKRTKQKDSDGLDEPTKKARSRGGRSKAPEPKAKDRDKARPKVARAAKADDGDLDTAIALATEEVEHPDAGKGKRRRRRRGGMAPSEPVNEPLPFISFVSAHPPGSEVDGEVESFSSHGAFVVVDGLRCYVPLAGLGDPPPLSARKVLYKGDVVRFVIQAFDPPRRGIELALPGFARVSGQPTEETVEAEISEAPAAPPGGKRPKAAKEAKVAKTSKAAKATKKAAAAKRAGRGVKAVAVEQPEPLQIDADVEPVITEAVPAVPDAAPKPARARRAAATSPIEPTPLTPKPARSKATAKLAPLTESKPSAKKRPATVPAKRKGAAKKQAAVKKKAASKAAAAKQPAKVAEKRAASKKPAARKAAKKAGAKASRKLAPPKAAATKKKAAPKKATGSSAAAASSAAKQRSAAKRPATKKKAR